MRFDVNGEALRKIVRGGAQDKAPTSYLRLTMARP